MQTIATSRNQSRSESQLSSFKRARSVASRMAGEEGKKKLKSVEKCGCSSLPPPPPLWERFVVREGLGRDGGGGERVCVYVRVHI
jgi:hypothetical protein